MKKKTNEEKELNAKEPTEKGEFYFPIAGLVISGILVVLMIVCIIVIVNLPK